MRYFPCSIKEIEQVASRILRQQRIIKVCQPRVVKYKTKNTYATPEGANLRKFAEKNGRVKIQFTKETKKVRKSKNLQTSTGLGSE